MMRLLNRMLACLLLVASTAIGTTALTGGAAEASQPYYCMCKGEKKRFLASTRHCEVALKLSKRKTCSANQYRVIYGLACLKQGCKLAK